MPEVEGNEVGQITNEQKDGRNTIIVENARNI
jgi:hypothetical protein